ncbi:DUF4446 family protein [Effusibacillus consociatus]|uniref:DUF4446 family protein n=1 Tax=Effusibacillus consociatus TaxID=1117041 RepID=A0ABV9Q3S6_9BACL
MIDYRQWILENLETVVLTIIGLLVLALFFFILNTVRLNQLHKRYQRLMRGADKSNLEELLFRKVEELQHLADKVKEVQDTQAKVNQDIQSSLGPIGIVRYNAFNDVGSDLSFSVAILNRDKNGVVISSLYGREDSRIYAKPVENGDSTYKMTDEEKEAICIAIESFAKR